VTLLRGFIFALFLLISVPVQLYLFSALRSYVRQRIHDARWRRNLISFSACFFVLMFLPIAWRAYFGLYGDLRYSGFFRGLLTTSSIWWVGSVGCAVMLFGYSLFRQFILRSKSAPAALPDPGRRAFLRKGAGMAVAAPFMVSGYGVLVERRRFALEHFDIHISGLSSALAQFSIVQLTDIHVGPFMSPEELAEYVEAVNRLQPDVIALTGDFVTGNQDEVAPCVTTLAGLKARYGVFACLGNHDIHAGVVSSLTHGFAGKGIQTLRNDSATLRVGDSKIAFLGIDDLKRGHPNLPRALATEQKNPAEVKILLSHRPEIFPTAARSGIDLVLSGHYHGGQVKLLPEPGGLSIASFLTPYAEGLFRLPRTAKITEGGDPRAGSLFVGRGVGITGLPIRINCPPQIAHLRLIKA
jgi:predicted MPP superfamily phosphohydrolase